MTNPNYTDITFILDRSGSMAGSEKDTIGGYNQYMADQAKVEGKCRVTTVLFDHIYEFLHTNIPISEMPKLNDDEYVVRGSTSLFDALGRSINEAGDRFRKMAEHERPGRVLFVIITDGGENSSKEFQFQQIADMIKTQQEVYDWDFVFLGADLDAFAHYGNLGIKTANMGSYGKCRTVAAFKNLSSNTTTYRSVSAHNKGGVNMLDGVDDKQSK